MRKKITIAFIVILGIAALCIFYIFGLYQGYWRLNYPSQKEYPHQGIDVSHHNGEIKWSVIDTSKWKFAFIKATEGDDFKDPKFLYNYLQAKKNGVQVGAYHFFSFCTDARTQAANFIETVPRDATNLPPVIDVEYGGKCLKELSHVQLITRIDSLANYFQNHYQQTPIIYVTPDFYNDHIKGNLKSLSLWIRNVRGAPKDLSRDWDYWQFANRGEIKGIDGFVDLNVRNNKN